MTNSSALPGVVIVGRPNVGKSTLYNRLVGRREALVADIPGMTRDRKEGAALLRGRHVRMSDTAGLEEAAEESLFGRMRASSETAVSEADLVLFCIDARAGVTPVDEYFASWLHRQGKRTLLVANKAEGSAAYAALAETYRLGFGEAILISAEHGEGIAHLMTEIVDHLPPDSAAPDEASPRAADAPLKLAIVGRPNAGKSTLLNILVGEERMITGPEAGLTRDAISVSVDDALGPLQIVDTAGLRKKARIEAPEERLSVSSTLRALKMAELVVLTVDATLGLHEQDLQIARLIEREGRACVLALNKWDALEDQAAARQGFKDRLETSLAQMRGIETVAFSALTGRGVRKLLPAVRRAAEVWNTRVPTGALNRWFEDVLERHPPPLVNGRRLKLRYITQACARPPTFVIFGTRVDQLPEAYRRYLVNGLRTAFHLPGTPIRLQLRSSENPFAKSHARK